MAEIRVGSFVRFKDTPEATGVVFEFQDDGMVAGLRNVSQKLIDMGVGYAAASASFAPPLAALMRQHAS